MVWTILGGTIIAVIGIFIFLKPDLVWELTEKWKAYRADDGIAPQWRLNRHIGTPIR